MQACAKWTAALTQTAAASAPAPAPGLACPRLHAYRRVAMKTLRKGQFSGSLCDWCKGEWQEGKQTSRSAEDSIHQMYCMFPCMDCCLPEQAVRKQLRAGIPGH
eukprot:1138008-Pelagomonas_calceolata.AAC.2